MQRATLATLTTLVMLGTAFVVIAGSAAAQGIDEPLTDKLDEKIGDAQADPSGFAQAQATEKQLAADANWTIAYACFVAHEAEGETGADVPDLDQCADFEEALGIAEEAVAEEEEEVVADAQELEDDAVAEAEALAEDALATVAEVIEDPAGALDALVALLDRTLRAVQRILDGITGGVGASATLLGDALGILGKGAAIAVAAPFVGAYKLGVLLWTGGVNGATAIGDGFAALVNGVVAAATATTDAITSGAGATWGALSDAAAAVQDALDDLLGAGDGHSTSDGPELPDRTDPLPDMDTADGLLDTITDDLDP